MAEKQVKDFEKFVVRFPDGMRDAIAERAKDNGRSMNSEIIEMLSGSLTFGSARDDIPWSLIKSIRSLELPSLSDDEKRYYEGVLIKLVGLLSRRINVVNADLYVAIELLAAIRDVPLGKISPDLTRED